MSAANRAAALAAALAFTSGMIATEARAQGFFQNLFGFGGGQSAPPPVSRPAALPPADYNYRQLAAPPPRSGTGDEQTVQKGGNYRTMCVRMCDGYYFPISASVSRRDFYRDARMCKQSCGAEAVLFYHPSSSGDASTMIDLTGRAYARLPNALRYRKQLVDGCKCRPEPWANSEIARHQRYAMEAARDSVRNQVNPDAEDKSAPIVSTAASQSQTGPKDIEIAASVTLPSGRSKAEIDREADENISASTSIGRQDAPQKTVPVKSLVAAPAPLAVRIGRHKPSQPTEATKRIEPRALRSVQKSIPSGHSGLGVGSTKHRWPGD